ncbi:MAG: ATP-binding protein [Mangrovibacterium sp.]
MPKLYFYDTGLAVSLLGIENAEQLAFHPFRGNLFENMIILELLKERYNQGKENNLFFWRDHVGNEIDLLLEKGNDRWPVEIKSGQTVSEDFFKGINFWNKLTGTKGGFIVYGGDLIQKRSNGIIVIPYKELDMVQKEGECPGQGCSHSQ